MGEVVEVVVAASNHDSQCLELTRQQPGGTTYCPPGPSTNGVAAPISVAGAAVECGV